MSERVALYARVSTTRQEQDKTIASQIEALEREARTRGWTVPPERRYVDESYSGSRLDRPGLDALRDAAADGLLDVVLICAPDRLARNYVHQQVILEELHKRGVEVHFLEHPIGERAEDRLLVQMQGVIAEYERAKIMERTRRGRLHKVRTGQMLPFPRAPYGYAIVRSAATPQGLVVIDDVQAEHVRAIYRWVLDDHLSARQVAKRLNAQGVRPPRARLWTTSTVYFILTHPAYAGTAPYGRYEVTEPVRCRHPGSYRRKLKSSRRKRPRDQWLLVPIPALVEEAMQRQVRARLANNRRFSPRNVQHEYLLRSLVKCGECGRGMSATAKRTTCRGQPYQYLYYACDGWQDPVDTGREHRCSARRVRADRLDAVVWEALTAWLQRPELLAIEVEAWRSSRQGSEQAARDQARLEGTCRQLQQQIERLVDAYQQGAIEVDELKARRERLDVALQAAYARQTELQAHQQDRGRIDRITEELTTFAATVRTGLDALDFTGRERLVRLLVERVIVTGNEVTVEHVVPLSGRFSGVRPADVRMLHVACTSSKEGLRVRSPGRSAAVQGADFRAARGAGGHAVNTRTRDPP